MRNSTLLRILLAMSLWATLNGGTAQAENSAGVENLLTRLEGTWVTETEVMPLPGGSEAHLRRTAVFRSDWEQLTVEAFADAALTQPILRYDSEGPMMIVGPWEAIPGSFAAELRNTRSDVTVFIDAPDLWRTINLGDCPLKVGEAVDITTCSSGPPFQVTDCVDLEVIAISEDNTRLQLGGGDVNRCEARPTELSKLVFFRSQP